MHPSPEQLPPALRALIDGYSLERVTIGETAATVFRLQAAGRPTLFLKIVPVLPAVDPLAECRRMDWLAGRLPVPRVLANAEQCGYACWLMSAIPGLDATEPALLQQPSRLVELLAHGLRQIHALPIDGCPFDQRLDAELAWLRAHLAARLELSAADGAAHEAVGRLAMLEQQRPHSEELVFTHGDYCLPNILIAHDRVSGFIDLGAAGVGDRYRDLALAARSITRNLGAAWVAPFFAAYGVREPDTTKLRFYRDLDEVL